MTRDDQLKTIIAALTEGPKTTPQIVAATGIRGAVLGNIIKTLLQRGEISREYISPERYRYYAGTDAPGWTTYERVVPAPKQPMQYRVPVKKVVVRPFSIAGENGTTAFVTMPRFPWECVA